MSGWTRRVWLGLTQHEAATAPDSEDLRLRGRTYAIPFDRVWRTALTLVSGGLRGWTLSEADDFEGVIRANARPLLRNRIDDVVIRISLDQDAQTRVDIRSMSRTGRGDFGVNARRIARFLLALDRALAKEPVGAGRRPGTASP